MMRNNIVFPDLVFTKPGVYPYLLKELTPSGDGWETDKSVYRVIVTVKENDEGTLYACAHYPDGRPIFCNCCCCC